MQSRNSVLASTAQWLSSDFMALNQDDTGSQTHVPSFGETETLLDISALLEIARWIEEIKKEGRLSGDAGVDLNHDNLQNADCMKGH